MSDRERSASPSRGTSNSQARKPKSSGFKWKEKRSNNDEPSERDSGRLERGYRDRSPRRDHYRDRTNARDAPNDRFSSRREYPDEEGARSNNRDRPRDQTHVRDERAKPSTSTKLADKPSKEKKKTKPAAPSGPMIVVNINDRLGTKAAIPCLPSDSIKAFKAIVAAHIGRQPHEIMLKRQGERPFKDQLTLEDYGVSNGVQLDLEIDTGD